MFTKRTLLFVACALTLAACNKTAPVFNDDPDDPALAGESSGTVRIVPLMTKVTETSFENTDAIGVTITPSAEIEGFSAQNLKFVHDGTAFSSSLKWYSTGTTTSTITAYYPWSATVPTSFTVQADQRNGTGPSDFVAGSKADVLPTTAAVPIPFKHKLTRIKLNVTNNAQGDLDRIVLKGGVLTAVLDQDFNASADPNATPGEIIACQGQSGYYLIVPPQTVTFTASVYTTGGEELSQGLVETSLAAGKQYTVNMIVNPSDLSVTLSGEVEGWSDGGEIGGAEPVVPSALEEHLTDGYIIYHDVQYSVVKMDDNKWWMAQNLAYVPEGITVSDDNTNVTAGVYYPLVLNSDQSAPIFSKDEAVIASNGYLYQSEVALGLNVDDLTTVTAAQALEGAQGICPDGWHIPTIADITGLVGKAVSPIETNANAPYYNGSNGSIALLNADGFNMEAYGMVSIGTNVATTGTLSGRMSGYDHLCSSMFCGSSYAGVTYNTANDESSGIKNLQFYGLMPMTNKAAEADYTCNGTKVSYRIAGPVRCVRDSQ